MSDLTRRDVLHRLALAIAAAGVIDRLDAEAAHRAVRQAAASTGGAYTPKALSAHEFKTLDTLTELIIPADTKPGARQAEVAAWIDLLLSVNLELRTKYAAGLAWIDQAMIEKGAKDFASATPAQQAALLDVIAYRKNRSPETDAGIDFFILARRMTADGFYTSDLGMRDVYMGNSPQTTFVVPQAAIDHVLGRSPLK